MCNQTCNNCTQCVETCNCPQPEVTCKTKKKCDTSLSSYCLEDFADFLKENLLLGDCLFTTVEDIKGKKKLKININPFCIKEYYTGNCTPTPTIPTITSSSVSVASGNKVILTATNYNGVVLWFNQFGENIGSGISINVGVGTYYAKSYTGCGYSPNSNIVTVSLLDEGLYTATRSTIVQKTCLPGCVSTSVVFAKTYTASTQEEANTLANNDSNFATEAAQYAQNQAECICNYCSNAITWNTPVITCNQDNTTTVNVSVSGNGSNPVEFYDYSLEGNDPYNPSGWVLGQTLNSYTSPTVFLSNASQHYFKARLKNCTNYIDGLIATCNVDSYVYSATRTASFTRNNCASGCTPSIVSFTKTYTSTVSQSDANNQAANDSTFNTQGQAYANTNGTCTNCCVDPLPAVTLTSNVTTICGTQTATITATGCTGTIQWLDGSGNAITNPNSNQSVFIIGANTTPKTIKARCSNCNGVSATSNTITITYTGLCQEINNVVGTSSCT